MNAETEQERALADEISSVRASKRSPGSSGSGAASRRAPARPAPPRRAPSCRRLPADERVVAALGEGPERKQRASIPLPNRSIGWPPDRANSFQCPLPASATGARGVNHLEPLGAASPASAGTTPPRTAGKRWIQGCRPKGLRITVEEPVDSTGRRPGRAGWRAVSSPRAAQRPARGAGERSARTPAPRRAPCPEGKRSGNRAGPAANCSTSASRPLHTPRNHDRCTRNRSSSSTDRLVNSPLVADPFAGSQDLVALERPSNRGADVGGQRRIQRVEPPHRLSNSARRPSPSAKRSPQADPERGR